ncbi:MAG: ABC transporter permease [Clostridia bacterium]|nr:ABC transporter permease [Clostridia bacterium]
MKVIGKLFNFLIFLFLYAPLFVMMFFSFNESKSTSVFSGFSLKWYSEMFSNRDTMEALTNTLVLALLSAVIATVLGTLAAVGIYRMRSRLVRNVTMNVTNIPMMNPDIVTGVSLMLLFVFIGRLIGASESLNFFTLLIAHVTFNLPYVILNVLPKLRQTDPHLMEAAEDLGCHPIHAFFEAVIPSIRPGIFSGFLMAFTLSIDDFVISYYTNGSAFQTLPLKIYSMTKKKVKPDMYALCTLIFITILVLLIIINIAQAKSEKNSMDSER